jgi:hypothetical protein
MKFFPDVYDEYELAALSTPLVIPHTLGVTVRWPNGELHLDTCFTPGRVDSLTSQLGTLMDRFTESEYCLGYERAESDGEERARETTARLGVGGRR